MFVKTNEVSLYAEHKTKSYKMKHIQSLLKVTILISFIISLSGCQKDNLELLSDTVWDFENFSSDTENTTIQGLIALGKAGLTDGTIEFNSDGAYTMDSPLINAETGTWELVGSNQIVFTTGGISRPATLEEVTKSKLVYFETYVYESETYSVKYVWVK